MNKKYLLFFSLLLLAGCYRVPDKISPKVDYAISDTYMESLPAAFRPLSTQERSQDWGKEYLIGQSFAKEMDLYRAISTFRRADILVPERSFRKPEVQYNILLCYYIGKRYEDAIYYFEHSLLSHVDHTFSAFHDLLIILYDCYSEVNNEEKIKKTYELLHKFYPQTASRLQISSIIEEANIDKIDRLSQAHPDDLFLINLLSDYENKKKSVTKAQTFNALLPGSGYLYLGQKRSALTSFLMNGLFIFAAVEFFKKGYVAAGIITCGFEAGWYFGGIYGAGLEAKYYNERIYETLATQTMNEQGLFPIFMLKYSF